jgi:hypothetical protein
VPDLEAAGYVLRIREINWFEHRRRLGPITKRLGRATALSEDRKQLLFEVMRAN